MTNQGQLKIEQNLKPFPPTGDTSKDNPAIRLYGLRFYKDQTPVEYLAEFLLVFASPKGKNADHAFRLTIDADDKQPIYWPEDRVALKLFAFLPSSKLETRHPVHQKAYLHALELIKSRVKGGRVEKDEAIRLLQSLFSGFVGVAKNRTWATYTFLPVSTALLARELDWLHSKAVKVSNLENWDDVRVDYFATDRHNFMARGGELLFLQLAHLFSSGDNPDVQRVYCDKSYEHIAKSILPKIKESIEQGLQAILQNSVGPIEHLVHFVEDALSAYRLHHDDKKRKSATLGWVPIATVTEALLFANELNNICQSTLGSLEKLDLLQLLCCMQVLRSLCFQARRVDNSDQCTDGFIGNYVWIVANPTADSGSRVRKLAQDSFGRIEGLLYRVLRQIVKSLRLQPKNYNEADKHGFQIFRKIAKDIGLVIPSTGRGQRFVLPPHLIRFLVAALVAPGERVRLTEFYRRVFAHYGIALGDQQLATALAWSGGKLSSKDYAVAADTAWVQEALQQGGFLVELSDAVSIVHNPVGRER